MILPPWRRPFAVLLYHDVSEESSRWSLPPSVFAAHLDALTRAGCSFVTMDQVSHALRGRKRLPARAVCVHFDDGRAGFWRAAWPRLKERGLPATLFVPSAWAGLEELPPDESYAPLMTWEELRLAGAEPLLDVGCHGRSHRNLKRVSRGELRGEVGGAKTELEAALGREIRHFAPPYNRVNGAVRRSVKAAGFHTLSAGGGGMNGRFATRYRIRRYLVLRETPVETIAALVRRLG